MTSNPKIVIFAHDIPYPPIHGGRVDMWNRILALSDLDIELHLITWSDIPVTVEQSKVIKEHVGSLFVLKRLRYPVLAFHPLYPSSVISRLIPAPQYRTILRYFRRVSPNFVLLDGLAGAIPALQMAEDLGVPLIYRSHNVEHKYIEELFTAETDLRKKTLLLLNISRTYKIERLVRQKSKIVYDISPADHERWLSEKKLMGSKILYPYIRIGNVPYYEKPHIDIMYIGNLYTPNNIHGLKWFIGEVLPDLPRVSVMIAGAQPTPEIRRICQAAGISLLPNPPQVQALYGNARVLINPIWHGSGVSIKMLEMLATGKPVVSTPVGIQGLSPNVRPYVKVGDSPAGFSEAIRNAMSESISSSQRQAVITEYGRKNVVQLVEDLKELLR